MESVKIEKLLNAYFEGNTSISEERILLDYFNSEGVAEDLIQFKPLFMGLKAAKEEKSTKTIELPALKGKNNSSWGYSIAAMFIVLFGIAGFYFSQPKYTQEEKEALAAFEKSKETMLLLSENLNKGAERLTFVDQFEIEKDKIFE